MINTVFDKTEQGREEIATRARHLAPRLRTLLLLVDGKRNIAELMSKVAGLGLDEKALVELLDGGFIEVAIDPDAPGTRTGASASDQQGQIVPASVATSLQSRQGAAKAGLTTAQATTAALTSESAATAPSANNSAQPTDTPAQAILGNGETQFQALYKFFSETIRSALGLRGYGMQLKVERASTIDDFRALRQPFLDAVMKAKGPEVERSMRIRLDQLLELNQ